MRKHITVDISAPPAVVWAVLSDVESWPEWTASVTSARRLSSERLQVGSRVRIEQPRLPATVWTVSDLVEGEQFTWIADNPGVRTRASHRVAGRADGSQATLWIDQGGVLGSAVGLLYGGLTRRYLQMEAAGLKQRSEESAAQHRV
ncbi:SRPBCC family protein [Blastococcus sp. VKM Ac-2987]|uniref:SRPBCC family protein n=1 Tax=Blastococcus sp. VKM Ac-2987 TaxID=3004141 RepID=UPI0022AB8338|nr:SRPBCC family protein [Blastococcus sp. VKM Ac-2987]MCZ2857240.1 SRPBCC family protein [Blastococcus sp. VKM Ac-2987]